jgi:uncharacterized protein (TIGR02996 family)
MNDEQSFLAALAANPADDELRSSYADWLEVRGQRAEYLRLTRLVSSLDPDHLQRPDVEERLSAARKEVEADWLALVEPPRGEHLCFRRRDGESAYPESQFHREAQDTQCDVWKRLLDLVEDTAAHGGSVLDVSSVLRSREDAAQLVSLPSTIGKLTDVRKLLIVGLSLVRLPPEIGEMASLEEFNAYMTYPLHWYPYEITRCSQLADSKASTRTLYGNKTYRVPFPRLPSPSKAFASLPLEGPTRDCSVCNQPFHDRRAFRVWISLLVATDVLPLLVNACSMECISRLPTPHRNYVQEPHRGGVELVQPADR